MGLSGLGDLTLTCNAMQSRNFAGVALGKGQRLIDILSTRRSVAEASHVLGRRAGQRHHIEMPICEAVDAVLAAARTRPSPASWPIGTEAD